MGDAFHWLDGEDQLFAKWLDPVSKALAGERPLVFARGNHEWRGPFARSLFDYVPTAEGRFYVARDVGPVHLLVLDSGEDRPDETNVYARLNRSEPYLAEELRWLRAHRASEPRMASAPFRVVLMHQPRTPIASRASTQVAPASSGRRSRRWCLGRIRSGRFAPQRNR